MVLETNFEIYYLGGYGPLWLADQKIPGTACAVQEAKEGDVTELFEERSVGSVFLFILESDNSVDCCGWDWLCRVVAGGSEGPKQLAVYVCGAYRFGMILCGILS